MSKELFDPPGLEISRKRFLRYTLGAAIAASLPLDWFCRSGDSGGGNKVPRLIGLSSREYLNINSVAEVFLAGSPVMNFDAGLAMDRYLYHRKEVLSIEKKFKELLAVPSSVLIALFFDLSFTPLCDLPLEEREARLVRWSQSLLGIKRTVYHAYRQGTLFMLTSQKEYQDYTGYTEEKYFRPFQRK